MKKTFLFFAGLFLFGSFFISQARAESIVPDGVEHVDSYDVVMNINADSSVAVSETIDYDYADKTKPGFSRYIPLTYQDLNGNNFSVGISDVSVDDGNGNQYAFSQSKTYSEDKKKLYLEIIIGDDKQPVSGSKTYVLRYTVYGAIKYMSDHDQLFWNITGDKWPVYVKYPSIKVNLPQKVDRDKITKECFIGLRAATVECSDRIESKSNSNAYYSYKGVVSGEGMTIVYGFPKGVVIKPTYWQGLGNTLRSSNRLFLILLLLAAVSFIGIVITIIYNRKKIANFLSWRNISKGLAAIYNEIKLYNTGKIEKKGNKWWVAAGVIFVIFFFSGGAILWRVGNILNKISVKGGVFNSVVYAVPGVQGQLKGESDDRINILLLGILGANHPGGGLNADTVMVASIEPKANKIALVSIPRDLWVMDPGKDTKSKINAVYAYGEEKGSGQGISDMENIAGDITGLPINYAAVVSTEGFAKIINTLGGVEVNLSKPFDESAQFADIDVCDSDTYTIPTGEFQYKKDKKGDIKAKYPLCANKNPECGGNFKLPAGKNILDGQNSLCFIRSRYLTSDFERAKRQQLILQQIKQKATQLGFTDFVKINSILNDLGDNVRTDLAPWEMKRFFDLYKGMNNPQIYQRVLEDSKEGLLYSPDKKPETGYILLPRGDSYDRIRNLFQNIFSAKNQSDIKPEI